MKSGKAFRNIGVALFVLSVVLFITPIVLNTLFGGHSHWFSKNVAARVESGSLHVWRYGSDWFYIDFAALAFVFFIVPSATYVIFLVIREIEQAQKRRREGPRGFEVLPLAHHAPPDENQRESN